MQVFLIRHPSPRLAAGICYGQLDVDCENPQPIAVRLHQRIPPETPIFSSPLKRARLLAEVLARLSGAALNVDARLSEIDFGDWEGKAWEEIDRAALDAWASDVLNFTPPGGESVARLRDRAIEFADALATLALPRVAIVSHAGVMRSLVGYWQHLPNEAWTRLEFPFGGLSEITV